MDYESAGPPDEHMEESVVHVNPMGDLRVHVVDANVSTGRVMYGSFYEDSRAFTDDPVQGFGPQYVIEERDDQER